MIDDNLDNINWKIINEIIESSYETNYNKVTYNY